MMGPRQILSVKFHHRTFEAGGHQADTDRRNQSKFMRFVLARHPSMGRGDDNGARSGINLLNSVNSHRCHSPREEKRDGARREGVAILCAVGSLRVCRICTPIN